MLKVVEECLKNFEIVDEGILMQLVNFEFKVDYFEEVNVLFVIYFKGEIEIVCF